MINSMNKQAETVDAKSIDSEHKTIMEGGKIEEFADALGRFCRAEGWKKLKDENDEVFRSLRHYVEAKPPFGAGYSGKAGMEKIEAYLSLNPRVKDYFQHCHANCLSDMAQEQGLTPAVVSKKEWNDVMGARLAKAIETYPEEIYAEKAAAYVEDKERVKPTPRLVNEYTPVRLSYRPSYTYAFAKKLKESLDQSDLTLLIESLNANNLEERVEFEKFYNSALTAFNRSKSESGWGKNATQAPEQLHERTPVITLSKWLDGEDDDGNRQLALIDESASIATVVISKTGTVKEISFN